MVILPVFWRRGSSRRYREAFLLNFIFPEASTFPSILPLQFRSEIPRSVPSNSPSGGGKSFLPLSMIPILRRRGKFYAPVFNIAFCVILLIVLYNGGNRIRVSSDANPRRHLSENSSLESQSCSPSGCLFVKSHPECSPGGFLDYFRFFYCYCENFKLLGFALLFIWLAALFFLLGNTAADYFCPSLEKLSALLRLPPTVAGVTLLPLGNGAPDVFSSIAAFLGSGSGEVGLNSVLGGAVFVTCVVVGVVALVAARDPHAIDRRCFVRDIVFFLVTLASLCFILLRGRVSLIGSLLFASLYILYAITVAANEILRKKTNLPNLQSLTPLLPVAGTFDEEDDGGSSSPPLQSTLPQWMWTTNYAIYSDRGSRRSSIDNPRPLWGWAEEEDEPWTPTKLRRLVLTPLSLPRKLTIPILDEDRWSKGYAVCSAALSPILLAFLSLEGPAVLPLSAVAGASLGALAYFYTRMDSPPRRFLFPWVLGGFIMSIAWFYIIANELVSLLVSLGRIFSIDPAILALTFLAWGNSMGDLSSNVALAVTGEEGVQIAMSGSYAGPIFNTLIGLGASMVLSSWSAWPVDFDLKVDSSLTLTVGFLVAGLLWALTALTRNDMKPSRGLGFGLLGLYAVFLCVRISAATGALTFMGRMR